MSDTAAVITTGLALLGSLLLLFRWLCKDIQSVASTCSGSKHGRLPWSIVSTHESMPFTPVSTL